ncbi:MAG TPA: site-specific DNA-methyltransferase [Gemmatimonadales bacterium]|nr:site-specific DNA-methyltransferase [Gemmatimonadales bacterium]
MAHTTASTTHTPPTSEQKQASRLTKEEWREYTKTVWSIANTSDPEHPAVFPPEIPYRLIKMFSFVGDRVLDPFAGTGTTCHEALALDRRAVAVEQNPEFAERIEAGHQRFVDDGDLAVHHGDCRDMSFLEEDSIGLIVTSPPYWNKADYGGNGCNLGNLAGYQEFLRGMEPVLEECVRVLAPGRKLALVTANVNQFTDHGLLSFPLAADMLTLLRASGLVIVGEVIWNKDGTGGRWGSSGAQRPIFGSYPFPPNLLFKTVHEHILIVAKPPAKMVRNPRALPYEALMA